LSIDDFGPQADRRLAVGWFNFFGKRRAESLANDLIGSASTEHPRQMSFQWTPPIWAGLVLRFLITRFPRLLLPVIELQRTAVNALPSAESRRDGNAACDLLEDLFTSHPTPVSTALAP
jgi:hypothetical protein